MEKKMLQLSIGVCYNASKTYDLIFSFKCFIIIDSRTYKNGVFSISPLNEELYICFHFTFNDDQTF